MEVGKLAAKAAGDMIQLYGVAAYIETQNLSGTADDWGDQSEDFTTGTVVQVLFQGINKNDTWSKTGLLESGDSVCYVKSTTTIKIRDRILKGSTEYEVVAIETGEFQGTTGFYRLACKRVAA